MNQRGPNHDAYRLHTQAHHRKADGRGVPVVSGSGGAGIGLEHYRCMSQASKKGAAFDDCLYRAKVWAQGQISKAERKAGKKKPGRVTAQPGLF